MTLFKDTFRTVRENSSQIYKGFGLRHRSDVTHYYVHPDNESPAQKTSLCQPIGEALILFALILQSMIADAAIGTYSMDDKGNTIYMEFYVPADYRQNGVVDDRIYRYCALCQNLTLQIAAYDRQDNWIPGKTEPMEHLYKYLPCICILLAKEIETNAQYRELMNKFLEDPSVDLYVQLHEDLYQNHKHEMYTVRYEDLSYLRVEQMKLERRYHHIITPEEQPTAQEPENMEITVFPDDAFSDAQKEMIPRLSGEFVLPNELSSICSAVANGDVSALLLHGPAGTGKTMACKLICQKIGLPILETINCTENLDEFVLGKYIPKDDCIVFHESYITEAIRNGGAVVFEEINFARPQYLAFLNSLLDDNGFVRLDTGEVVRRHENFRFFATMNMGYFGTKELNQSLYNRFHAIIEIAALSDAAITRMLSARVPECIPVMDKVLSVYHKLKKKIESEELDVVISPRNLENWMRMAKYEGYLAAAEKTLISIAKCDRMLEDSIRGIIKLYKWKD